MPDLVTQNATSGYKQVRFSDLPFYLLAALREFWVKQQADSARVNVQMARLEQRLAALEATRTQASDQTATPSSSPSNDPADTTTPVITLNGLADQTILVGSTWSDLGATATDDRAVVGSVTVQRLGSDTTAQAGQMQLDTTEPSENVITYRAIDAAGNQASVDRRVRVVADPPPAETGGEIAPAQAAL